MGTTQSLVPSFPLYRWEKQGWEQRIWSKATLITKGTHDSSPFLWFIFLLPEQHPLWEVSAPPFAVHRIGPFTLWKRPKQTNKQISPKNPFLAHGSIMKSSLCPQLSPFCVLHTKSFTNPACNYHQEESHLFWAVHMCFLSFFYDFFF